MSVDFKKRHPIYVQIADNIHERILLNEYEEENKIPSIREQAVKFEVNPNTVQRSYELLQQQEVIFTKRGLGYFVEIKAKEKILALRKAAFLQSQLPEVFKQLLLLGIDNETFQQHFEAYKATLKSTK